MKFSTITLCFSVLLWQALAWEALPQIPSGHRSQFLVLHENGGYKYGYDTGDGSAAKQSADSSNQVSGHYFYKNNLGQDVDLKYTAGVQGFVPEGLEKLYAVQQGVAVSRSAALVPQLSQYASKVEGNNFVDPQANTGDASYNFNIDTDSYKRHENSDAHGNIQGSYSYSNAEGTHNLKYIAGENTGFVATSGSLAQPNGLINNHQGGSQILAKSQNHAYVAQSGGSNNGESSADGSYSFGYSTGESSRQESSDANNNIQGKFAYQDAAGNHDLSYVAGAKTGFMVTGGSLSQPNGLVGQSGSSAFKSGITYGAQPSSISQPSGDASYNFAYNTGDHAHQQSSDASGNVQGSYSYKSADGGDHTLNYVAGSSTGFLPTGGNLAQPSSLLATSNNLVAKSSLGGISASQSQNPTDGSYSFAYNTGDHSRQESSDASGNVQGSYSYKSAAGGDHTLNYVAGSSTGFLPTGGNLAQPSSLLATSNNHLAKSGVYSASQTQPSSDGSYSFGYNTGDHSHQQSSDASGNVQGSYSYKSADGGDHTLNYVAGSSTGFLPTGGNLAQPSSIPVTSSNNNIYNSAISAKSSESSDDDEANTGDASYNFTIDTDEYTRHEASDANGNVQGRYSYKNSAGNHDLTYVAGSGTGFVASSGSLKTAPGLNEAQLRSAAAQSYNTGASANMFKSSTFGSVYNNILPVSAKSSGNAVVHTYLPPNNNKGKFGYIYESS